MYLFILENKSCSINTNVSLEQICLLEKFQKFINWSHSVDSCDGQTASAHEYINIYLSHVYVYTYKYVFLYKILCTYMCVCHCVFSTSIAAAFLKKKDKIKLNYMPTI